MKAALGCLAGLLGAALLSACGGGGSSGGGGSIGTATASQPDFSGGGANVVPVSVNAGPASAEYQTFNIPLVSVTVCEPGTSTCATIPNVLVDTGSSGLRLMASALASAGISLSPMTDPDNSANTIAECLPFADGYTWGAVATATVMIGGETSSSAIPLQVVDDNGTSPAPPSACTSNGSSLDSVNDFDADGVLGVTVFNQDCGQSCVSDSSNDIYFSCTTSGSCSSTALALADQVSNPAASFPTDNNGVILQLAAVSATGATTGAGYLVFGIGTESNNGLGSAQVLTANEDGNFTTTFEGSTLASSFIDSGSNALYFNDSSLATCGASAPASEFYCPSSTVSLSATNEGANGTTSDVSFQIADINDINDSYFAIDDVGGGAESIADFGAYFDWGLPFFYGSTVYNAIEGMSAGGTVGPYYAYIR